MLVFITESTLIFLTRPLLPSPKLIPSTVTVLLSEAISSFTETPSGPASTSQAHVLENEMQWR